MIWVIHSSLSGLGLMMGAEFELTAVKDISPWRKGKLLTFTTNKNTHLPQHTCTHKKQQHQHGLFQNGQLPEFCRTWLQGTLLHGWIRGICVPSLVHNYHSCTQNKWKRRICQTCWLHRGVQDHSSPVGCSTLDQEQRLKRGAEGVSPSLCFWNIQLFLGRGRVWTSNEPAHSISLFEMSQASAEWMSVQCILVRLVSLFLFFCCYLPLHQKQNSHELKAYPVFEPGHILHLVVGTRASTCLLRVCSDS